MFCTKCGKDNGDGNKFCIECGAPLNVPSNQASQESSPEETLDVFASAPKHVDTSKGSDTSTTILGDETRIILTRQDGEEFKLSEFPVCVGKGSAADFIISGDESMSRKHFCIHEYGDDGFVIEDLNSSNKTYLNGNVLDTEELVVLNSGDVIKAGKTELTTNIIY